VVGALDSFDGKPLKSVARGALDEGLAAEEKAAHEAAAAQAAPLLAKLKEALGERVADVRASTRLIDSPACLVVGEGEASPHMERILRSAGHALPAGKPVLEVNTAHPLLQRLSPDDPRLADWASLLHDQALLAEGASPADPAAFVRSLNALMVDLAGKPQVPA
jgi:molecular chaperone HtpG